MSKAKSLRDAEDAIQKARAETCGSCDTIVIDTRYCSDCASYWQDVSTWDY